MSDLPVIFVPPEFIDSITGNITVISSDEIHHLLNVLRVKKQDQIVVMDNLYNSYTSRIINVSKKEIILKINNMIILKKYPQIDINLVQAIIKPDKLDFIVQKSTELGVSKIINFWADYSTNKNCGLDTIEKKQARLEKIALSAAKQSKRATLPVIEFKYTLEDVIKSYFDNSGNNVYLAFVENSTDTRYLKEVLMDNKDCNIFIFIGPEGGWSNHDLEIFEKYNIHKLSLGKNILRAETAAIVAIGTIVYELELAI